MTPDEISEFAHRLLNGFKEEAAYRCVASKVYYAVYHRAKMLVNNNLSDEDPTWEEKGNNHSKVAMAFQRMADAGSFSKSPLMKKLSRTLFACKDLRVKADYKLEDAFTRDDVDSALKHFQRAELLMDQMSVL